MIPRDSDDESTHDFGIGSATWPGLAKLIEEAGELQQVLGKLIALGHDGQHWDGTRLRVKLVEELGDVRAAMIYFCEANGIAKEDVHGRARKKLKKFRDWHEVYRSE